VNFTKPPHGSRGLVCLPVLCTKSRKIDPRSGIRTGSGSDRVRLHISYATEGSQHTVLLVESTRSLPLPVLIPSDGKHFLRRAVFQRRDQCLHRILQLVREQIRRRTNYSANKMALQFVQKFSKGGVYRCAIHLQQAFSVF
jgi:hypothetical protein